MNDDLYLEYMMNMVGQAPDQAELKRKQALVDALRKNAMTPQQGQMISGHYVGPGIAGALSQLGQAYFSSKGQEGVDAKVRDLNINQSTRLNEIKEALRRRRLGNSPGGSAWGMDVGQDDGYQFGGNNGFQQ